MARTRTQLRQAGTSAAGGPPPDIRHWVAETPASLEARCALTPAELAAARAEMRIALLRGHRPVPAGTAPVAVMPQGPIGAGKSTVARAFVAARHPNRDFVEVDLDDAIAFHPLGAELWRTHDAVTGRAVPAVGHAAAYAACVSQLAGAMGALVTEELVPAAQYNIVFHTHDPNMLHRFVTAGFHTVALFVAVPLRLNQQRVLARAAQTGRYWSAVADIRSQWVGYAAAAPWWGLWAHEFWLADNRGSAPEFRSVSLRAPGDTDAAWTERMRRARSAVDALLYAPLAPAAAAPAPRASAPRASAPRAAKRRRR